MSSSETCNLLSKEVDEFGDISRVCDSLGSDILKHELSIVKLVEDLGPYLINTDAKLRERGTSAFVQVLQNLPEDFLSEKELKFIALFFCDRIKDHHSIIPAVLRGILAIVKMKNLPTDASALLSISLFNHVNCSTQVQSDRFIYYQVIHTLISQRSEDLQTIQSEFVVGVISAMDGERDPRNLMFLFSILPEFLRSFPLGQLTEDAFEVIGCYFPIDFNPIGNDTSVITREDLANALMPCLLAIPAFGEFCIPLLLEKLNSSLRQAKIDSFILLREGCNVWSTESLCKYSKELWLFIKKELLPSTDAQLYEVSTSVLKAMLANLPSTDVINLVSDIMLSCEGLLADTQLSLFEPATKLLLTTAQASELTCKIVVTKVLPLLLALQKVNNDSDNVVVTHTLVLFMETCLSKHLDLFSEGGTLSEAWADVVKVFYCGTQSKRAQVRERSYHAFTILTSQVEGLAITQLCSALSTAVTSERSLEVRKAILECLKTVSRNHSGEIEKTVVPTLIIKEDEEMNLEVQEWRFEALCSLASSKCFIDIMIQQFTYLVSTCTPLTSVALKCLRNILNETEGTATQFVEYLTQICNIVQFLVSWWLKGVSSDELTFSNEELLLETSRIIEASIRPLSSVMQMSVVEPLLEMLIPNYKEGQNGLNFLSIDAPSRYTQVVSLLEALIGSLRPDVDVVTKQNLERLLLPLAVQSDHILTQTCAVRLFASIINKLQQDEVLTAVLNNIEQCVEHTLNTSDKQLQIRAALLHIYVTKGLVLRAHASMHHWLDKLIALIEHDYVGEIAANGFEIIMKESEWYLNSSSYCNVRLLYRQRLFMVVPKIVTNYGSCVTTNKTHYLIALAHIMQGVPHTVLIPQLPQILPMLVQSLGIESSQELVLTTLSTVSSLLDAKETVLEQYTDTFIPRFLKISRISKYMKVRIAALKCLNSYLDYSPILLLPYKPEVIRDLELCLDDKKRLVRQETARTRSRWYLLGAPTPEM